MTQTVAKWAGLMAPWVPQMGSAYANAVASDNPLKAAEIRRNAGMIANVMGGVAGMVGGGAAMPQGFAVMDVAAPAVVEAQPKRVVIEHAVATPREDFADEDENDGDDVDESWTPPKAIRQVLAQMDDGEAAKLTRYLDDLDEDEADQLGRNAESIASLDERVAWARGLTYGSGLEHAANGEEDSPTEATPASGATTIPTVGTMGIPPALFPVLAQLTPDERVAGAQLLDALDLGTLEQLTAQLVAMPPQQALATVRSAIADGRRRQASVAQRAVRAALRDIGGAAGEEVQS